MAWLLLVDSVLNSGFYAFILCTSKALPSKSRKKAYSRLRLRGSMTIEAALVLPIFLFMLLSLAFVIEAVRLQLHIGCALGQTAKEMASYGYLYDELKNQGMKYNDNQGDNQGLNKYKINNEIITIPSLFFAENRIKELAGEDYLNSSILSGDGISLEGSKIMRDDRWIDLKVSYDIGLPFSIIPNAKLKITQSACSYVWTGHIDDNGGDVEAERIVYKTEYGSRYHLDPLCKYLDIKIKQIAEDNLSIARNASGAKYYPCNRCISGHYDTYYITEYGSSYHSRSDCGAISRKIISLKQGEVNGLPCCRECENKYESD